MVGQQTLDLFIGVRIPAGQPTRAPQTGRGAYSSYKGLLKSLFSLKLSDQENLFKRTGN